MPFADHIADRFVGHHVDILRLAESERDTIFQMLGQLQADLLKRMDKQIPLPGFETFKQQRLQALFTLTDKLIGQQYGRIAKEHQSTLIDLAEFESEKTRTLLNRELKVPLLSVGVPLPTLKAMVNDDIVEGRPAKEWWAQQGNNLRGRYQQTIRQGVFAGETLDQLKQRVRGTQARNYQDGIMAISGRDAEALIRTSVQSVANSARYETLKANDDVIAGFQALVTLDLRTSELCMGRSGYAWDLDGQPLNPETKIPFPGPPPWHWGCRTTLVPVLKSWEQLQKEAKQNDELGKKLDTVEKKLGPGTQASMDGQVAGDLTYQQWLEEQPEERQIAVLGRNRWQLWRRNVLNLSDLVDQVGRPLTLDALKAKHGIADIADIKSATAKEIKDDETIVPQANPDDNPYKVQRELASKAVIAIKRNPNSGANGSKIVTFVDQTKGVFKPEALEEDSLRPGITRYFQREALASDVATIVRYNDLVPTTAVTTLKQEPGSIQAFVSNSTKGYDLTGDQAYGQSARDVRRAILFDVVLGNTDRHGGNWLVNPDGKLVLIDHGLILSKESLYLRLGLMKGLTTKQRAQPIPENMKTTWRKNWPKIEAAMQARGIEREAIRRAKTRLDRILTPGRTWEELDVRG